jgi:hypothetical protein
MPCATIGSRAAWVRSAHTAAIHAKVSQDGLLIGSPPDGAKGNIDTGVGLLETPRQCRLSRAARVSRME